MKKLLLILLCLPMIGFGQAEKPIPFSFAIGPSSLIPFNSTYNTPNVHTNTGISTNLSYKIDITKHYTYNVKYIPSISFNLVSFTRWYSSATEYNSNFYLLSIRNGIGKDINNRLSFSYAVAFDVLLKDKGTYTINYDDLTFGDINTESVFVYHPTQEDISIGGTSSGEYERNKLGYYGSFNIKFSYIIFHIHFLQFFVFTDFNVPFYYSEQLKNQSSHLQFNRFSSVGLGLNF